MNEWNLENKFPNRLKKIFHIYGNGFYGQDYDPYLVERKCWDEVLEDFVHCVRTAH